MTLRLHYKNSDVSARGYLFVSCAQDYERFSSGFYQPLPRLSGDEYAGFLSGYNEVVQDTLEANRDRKFFAMTPFALRNTWQSSFYQGAEHYARLLKVKDGDIHFFSPEWFLHASYHMNADVDPDDVRHARRDLYKMPLHRLYMAYQGIRFAFSRWAPRQELPQKIRFLIASVWTKTGVAKWQQTGQDLFHGDFPRRLVAQGCETAILYHAEGETLCIGKEGPVPAFNFTSYLKPADWFRLAWKILFFRASLRSSSSYPCQAIYRDISSSLSNQIPLALISYFASRNVLSVHRDADFITLYENNCWEQGVLQAARENKSKVTSFQHTAFSPSLLKMDHHIVHKNLPDKIMASGDETARILRDVMGHKAENIETGCSLRHKIDESERINRAGNKVLVLLQGAPDDTLFLHMVGQSVRHEDMIIRSHPSWPVHSDHHIFSQNSLAGDLAQAGLVLYTGTTAVFEALAVGVPAIHIDLHGGLSADPLFALSDCDVKKTWAGDDSLLDMIADIKNMPDSIRTPAFEIAHDYIDHYFVSADATALAQLIKKVTDE